jgi:hypothetical protein
MLLKSLIFCVYNLILNTSFYLFIFIVLTSFIFLFIDLRRKFLFFILLIICYSIWGFMLDLDGIMLVFLTAEFTIFLLFLMTYLQLYGNFSFMAQKINYLLLIICFLPLFFYSPLFSFYFYNSFYKSLFHVVSSDFYILYYFLFEKLPLLVILITLIISFFSLFFIILYFNLKIAKLNLTKSTKNLYFLRKQQLLKQTNFSSKLYTFQK